jgi:hypothetical protein
VEAVPEFKEKLGEMGRIIPHQKKSRNFNLKN